MGLASSRRNEQTVQKKFQNQKEELVNRRQVVLGQRGYERHAIIFGAIQNPVAQSGLIVALPRSTQLTH
jgi:hypothetical protein